MTSRSRDLVVTWQGLLNISPTERALPAAGSEPSVDTQVVELVVTGQQAQRFTFFVGRWGWLGVNYLINHQYNILNIYNLIIIHIWTIITIIAIYNTISCWYNIYYIYYILNLSSLNSPSYFSHWKFFSLLKFSKTEFFFSVFVPWFFMAV